MIMRKLFRRGITRNQEGATALEFALIFPVFLVFIFAIMDLGAYFFVAGQMQTAVEQASRKIRVGDVSVIGTSQAKANAFRDLVCAEIDTNIILNCAANLRVDVRTANNFGALVYPDISSLDANHNGVIDPSEVAYNTGGSQSAVIARVYYNYAFIIPALRIMVSGGVMPNTIAITSTTAFRNEPF